MMQILANIIYDAFKMQDILTTCGFDKLSCALDSNIFSGSIILSGQVHSLATGIGNTSLDATRDWLMRNVLVATDDYSKDLSANMTSILRSKYSVDDRVRKAWFINPGHKWRRASTGVQSQLLLSDRVIIFAAVTLNDGSGNILRRRMLEFTHQQAAVSASQSFGSRRDLLSLPSPNDDARFADALQSLVQRPATESMPPVMFGINVPLTIASIYGEEQEMYLLLTIEAVGRFDGLDAEQVNKEMMRRVMENQKTICSTCKGVYPAFENMLPASSSSASLSPSARRLLQQQKQQQLFDGSVTILLVYEKGTSNAIVLSYPDILMSIYNNSFTSSLLPSSTDATALEKLALYLSNNNIFVSNVTAQSNQNINIVVTTKESIVLSHQQITPKPEDMPQHIDVQVYGMDAGKWHWNGEKFKICEEDMVQDGHPQFDKCTDVPSSARSFDPMIGTIFLVASLLIFWM